MQSVEICGKKAAYLCGRLAVQRRGVRIYDGKSYERQFQLKRWLKSVKIVTPAEDGRSLWVYYADGELSKVNIENFTCEKQVKICLKPALHRFSAVEMQQIYEKVDFETADAYLFYFPRNCYFYDGEDEDDDEETFNSLRPLCPRCSTRGIREPIYIKPNGRLRNLFGEELPELQMS